MAIYLVQHGKSRSAESDPTRGLSDEGVAQVTRIAEVAKDYGVFVSRIYHSGKKRAEQTAAIFDEVVGTDEGVVKIDGVKPLDDVTSFAKELDPASNSMVVGHLPFMERLTSYLITGSTEYRVFKFQNGGIVCLDSHPDGGWTIRWALMPEIG